jgi:tRNA threonylcarbamoyladenosine biosynthesis protein TsaB
MTGTPDTPLLALDTSTLATTVAVMLPGGEVIEGRDDPIDGERPRHAERVLELADDVLVRAGVSWGEISRLAVGVGPGGFTGLRIGIAVARALAQALAVDVVPVSSLKALASKAVQDVQENGLVAGILDARRGEVFVGVWCVENGVISEPVLVEIALRPEALSPQLFEFKEAGRSSLNTFLAVGDGAVRYRDEVEACGFIVPSEDQAAGFHRVSAAQICRLARSSEPRSIDQILPNYCREPDAKVPKALATIK